MILKHIISIPDTYYIFPTDINDSRHFKSVKQNVYKL